MTKIKKVQVNLLLVYYRTQKLMAKNKWLHCNGHTMKTMVECILYIRICSRFKPL